MNTQSSDGTGTSARTGGSATAASHANDEAAALLVEEELPLPLPDVGGSFVGAGLLAGSLATFLLAGIPYAGLPAAAMMGWLCLGVARRRVGLPRVMARISLTITAAAAVFGIVLMLT